MEVRHAESGRTPLARRLAGENRKCVLGNSLLLTQRWQQRAVVGELCLCREDVSTRCTADVKFPSHEGEVALVIGDDPRERIALQAKPRQIQCLLDRIAGNGKVCSGQLIALEFCARLACFYAPPAQSEYIR